MDPRVIDINPIGRFFLVNFIITTFRSPKSAKLYKEIWNANGSPLLYYTRRQKELLQEKLGADYHVEFAMRYQNPSIESVLRTMNSPGINKIKVIPLFPQYASASTGSVHEEIMRIISKWQVIPEIEFINSYHDDEQMIQAFAENAIKYNPSSFDHILFSFHGLPERQIRKADSVNHCRPDSLQSDSFCCAAVTDKNPFCYRAQSFATARLLAERMNIPQEKYTVCFQSRLGRAEWIKPYTSEVLAERAKKGNKRLLVFAPAFTSDCLETIYEIGTEYHHLFQSFGGEKVQMVESLNEHPLWIEALEKFSRR
jgi:ferrochelatase